MYVIVLNADYTYLHSINWKRAIKLVMQGKVEVLKNTEKVIEGFNEKVVLPLVVRLMYFVRRLYKTKVPLQRKNVFVRDEFTCQYCGKKCKTSPTIDHIIPRSRGGGHCWNNSVTACIKCNQKKGNKTPKESKMTLIKKPVQPTINEFAKKKLKLMGVEDIIEEFFSSSFSKQA